MLVLGIGDKIRGDSTSANEVDYTLHGVANNLLKQMANGQLAAAIGDLYAAATVDTVIAIIIVNTGAAHNHVNLYLTPSGGTARRLIPKDMQLEPGYSLHFDGKSAMILDTTGGIVYGATVSDSDYGVSWNGIKNIAPSQNAVYNQMELRAPKASPIFTGTVTLPFSVLGTGSPVLKLKRLSGTTNASEGGQTPIAHGLTSSKVLGAIVVVRSDAATSFPPNHTYNVGYQYDFHITSTYVYINNHATNSDSILSKPIIVTMLYEE